MITSFDNPQPLPLPEDPSAARRAIAQDVLAQLTARRIVPAGIYLDIGGFDVTEIPGLDPTQPLNDQDVRPMLAGLPPCEVCAIGAALVSYIGLYNGIKGRQIELWSAQTDVDGVPHGEVTSCTCGSDIHRALHHVWPKSNLDTMEGVFEAWGRPNQAANAEWYINDFSRAVVMTAIFQNVLESPDALFDPARAPQWPTAAVA